MTSEPEYVTRHRRRHPWRWRLALLRESVRRLANPGSREATR